MRKKWVCSNCSYIFSRKGNLKRHYENIHGLIVEPVRHQQQKNVPRDNYPWKVGYQRTSSINSSDSVSNMLDQISELAKVQNTMANSRRTFERLNFSEQKSSYFEKQLYNLHTNNWIFSKLYIKGLSGYICTKCRTFSFKPVIDIGYDITMQSKHRCYHQGNFVILEIPPEIQDFDNWASKKLLDQLNYYIPLGKLVIAEDYSKVFKAFGKEVEIRDAIIGIPDRYPLYSFNSYSRLDWLERVIANPGKKMIVTDDEILDFFRRVKSTYAIFQIHSQQRMIQFLIRFTQ